MNKKRIRQMNTLLLRRLQKRPAAAYFEEQKDFLLRLERENYMQRFAGLVSGERIRCGAVLELCREELAQLCPRQPQEGWLRCAFDFALKLIEILAGAEKAKEVQHAIHYRGTEETTA